MKLLLSVLTFAITLALSSTSVAESTGGEHHDPLSEKMNSFFPKPQAREGANITPDKPTLSAPKFFAAMAADKVELTWGAVEGADEYHVQVAKDPNFKWLVKDDNHHKSTSFEITNLEAGKHYYWRVAAVKSGNWDTFRKSYFATSMFETK